jgi:hypothetical protein
MANNLVLWLTGKRSSPFGAQATLEVSVESMEHIYATMVAGSFKVPSGANAEQTAYWLARESLDTDAVVQLTGVENGVAYYIAVPSASLSNVGRFKTSLAACIPGHPDHKGDGAYVLRFPESDLAVVALKKNDGTLRIFVNEISPIFEIIEDSGLTVFECADCSPTEMVSRSLAASESAFQVAKAVTNVALIILTVSAVLLAITSAVGGLTGSKVQNKLQAREQQMKEVASHLNLSSPLAKNIALLNRVTSIVTRAGGWVKTYKVDALGSETFEVEFPEWVSKDYLEPLGDGVIADLDRVRHILVVVKGSVNPGKAKFPGDASTPAPEAK